MAVIFGARHARAHHWALSGSAGSLASAKHGSGLFARHARQRSRISHARRRGCGSSCNSTMSPRRRERPRSRTTSPLATCARNSQVRTVRVYMHCHSGERFRVRARRCSPSGGRSPILDRVADRMVSRMSVRYIPTSWNVCRLATRSLDVVCIGIIPWSATGAITSSMSKLSIAPLLPQE